MHKLGAQIRTFCSQTIVNGEVYVLSFSINIRKKSACMAVVVYLLGSYLGSGAWQTVQPITCCGTKTPHRRKKQKNLQ